MTSAVELLWEQTGGAGLRAQFDPEDAIKRDELHEDLDLETFLLDVVAKNNLDVNVADAVVDGEIIATMDGPSNVSVTIHDPKRVLIRSGIFHVQRKDGSTDPKAINVTLDGYDFRLVKVKKQDDDLLLTFEDLDIAYMKQHDGPRKVSRSKFTRAEFILALVRTVKKRKIKFYSPELHKKQAIAKAGREERDEALERQRERGIDKDAKLKVWYVGGTTKLADEEQIKTGTDALEVADSVSAPPRAQIALIAALMVEGRLKNPQGGDGTSVGPLQLTDDHYGGDEAKRRDLQRVVHDFLMKGFTGAGGAIKLARAHPDWDPGRIAQEVQGSAFDDRYGKAAKEAEKWVDEYGPGGSKRLYRRYEFKVEPDENYWQGALRLADEVNWRLFMVQGWLYFIAEEDLIKSKPRLRISESTPGIENIDWDIDEGKPVHEAVVTARVNRWKAPPGTVIVVEDSGPGNGKWLVWEVRRPLFSSQGSIILRRSTPSKPEPRPDFAEQESEEEGGDRGILAVYQRAKAIHKKHYPYVYGGGHLKGIEEGDKPSAGGYDCSAGVAACLLSGGFAPGSWKSGVPNSGEMAATYGKRGRGKKLTLWANEGHAFLEVKIKGEWKHLGTGDFGKGWRGFGVNPNLHGHAGFTPRHWPGT